MKNLSAIIVAGGMGTRLGASVPKAFVSLGKRPLFMWSVQEFDHHKDIAQIILVVPKDTIKQANTALLDYNISTPLTIVAGGDERWQSVSNGIMACDTSTEWVLIHDAARPFISSKVINSLLSMQNSFCCAITATPVTDTIRSFKNDLCIGTIDRSTIIRVGTPQMFLLSKLTDALPHGKLMNPPPTDEVMLLEKLGEKVGFSWGDPLNFKITTHEDLMIAEALVYKNKW